MNPEHAETLATSPTECIQRIQHAINAHDLGALTLCFAPDYESEFPAHLERSFRGIEQMRVNWTGLFRGVPDIHAELLRSAEADDVAWTEWEWTGTQRDGEKFWQRGVTLQRVANGRVVWARLYIEPVHAAPGGAGIPAALLKSASTVERLPRTSPHTSPPTSPRTSPPAA